MRAPRVGPWGPNVRAGGTVAGGGSGGASRAGLVRGHGLGPSLWWPRASGVRPHSLWWAAQGREMCGGEGTAMCGEPRVAAECTYAEREVGRCSRPTVRPGRNVNDERDHGDGSDTRPRGRRTSGSLTETRVRDWQYLPGTYHRAATRPRTRCSVPPVFPPLTIELWRAAH